MEAEMTIDAEMRRAIEGARDFSSDADYEALGALALRHGDVILAAFEAARLGNKILYDVAATTNGCGCLDCIEERQYVAALQRIVGMLDKEARV